jgi:tRNA pseudouridine-54 N-methylase
MQESQVLIYKDIQKVLKQDLNDSKKRELITLAYVVLSGDKHSIALHVEKALDAGATRRDILNVVSCIVGDARLLSSILELLRALSFEVCDRSKHISNIRRL